MVRHPVVFRLNIFSGNEADYSELIQTVSLSNKNIRFLVVLLSGQPYDNTCEKARSGYQKIASVRHAFYAGSKARNIKLGNTGSFLINSCRSNGCFKQ